MRRQYGFTLLELLVTVSIVVVLTAVALPSFNFVNNKRIAQSQVDNLQRALALARQTAIASNKPTVVCPSGDGASCGDAEAWSRGFMIYEDSNRNEAYDDSADRLLEYIPGVKNVATRQDTSHLIHSLTSNGADNRVTFTSQGFTNDMQTFTYCDGERRKAFTVILNMAGRVKVKTENGSSC